MKRFKIQKGRGQALVYGVLAAGLFLLCAVAVLSWLFAKEVIAYEISDYVLFVAGIFSTLIGGLVAGAGEKEMKWINPALIFAVAVIAMGLSWAFNWGEGRGGWMLLSFALGCAISIALLARKTGSNMPRHKRVRC